MTHKRVTKPGDIGAVDEVLGWDPRGTSEEYEYVEKAQEAFSRIKKELSALRAANKQEKQKYAELSRMNEGYVKHLHAAERERDEACQKEREGCARICDLEFAANWHSAAMAAANAAKRCAELIRATDKKP
jgi:polysaccharide pyruvyl transferase WcaK-like protein